jgi:beta-mannosidase
MAAVDFYRAPTRVHAQVARSFEPVLASLEFDREEWRTGEEVRVGVWGINDLHKAIANAEVRWRYEDGTGKMLTSGQFRHSFGPDSAEPLGEAKWVAGTPGGYRLVAEVTAGGEKISENEFEFRVAP